MFVVSFFYIFLFGGTLTSSNILFRGVAVVVVVWQLDLHLPMQSLPITTIVIFSGYPCFPHQ